MNKVGQQHGEIRSMSRLRPAHSGTMTDREARRRMGMNKVANATDVSRQRVARTPVSYGIWAHREGVGRKDRTVTRVRSRRREPQTDLTKNANKVLRPQHAEEERARIGTGFRVRREGKTRRFDVGFSDVKTFDRPAGREATVASGQTTFTLKATGPNAQVRLGNAVHLISRLRPRNAYTGTGIVRKRDRGIQKLKPTKKDKA